MRAVCVKDWVGITVDRKERRPGHRRRCGKGGCFPSAIELTELEGEPTGSQETEPEKCVQRASSEQCMGSKGGRLRESEGWEC